jgi:hypothetical protein
MGQIRPHILVMSTIRSICVCLRVSQQHRKRLALAEMGRFLDCLTGRPMADLGRVQPDCFAITASASRIGSNGWKADLCELRVPQQPVCSRDLLDCSTPIYVRADGLWLVWPDGYVACSSSDTRVIAHYLDDVIRPHAVAA